VDATVGYDASVESTDVTLTDNYLAGKLRIIGAWQSISMTGNSFLNGIRTELDVSSYTDNEVTEAPPTTGIKIFTHQNAYDPSRARVTIYNWAEEDSVDVDLGDILKPGERYEIRSVFDLYGPAILEGSFDGELVSIPMGSVPATPVNGYPEGIEGDDDPGKQFGVFLIKHLGCQ